MDHFDPVAIPPMSFYPSLKSGIIQNNQVFDPFVPL